MYPVQKILLKRLLGEHEKYMLVADDIRRSESGDRGEDRLVAKLDELRLSGNLQVFSDVGLVLEDWKVQIDCLIVSDRCCMVIESKNMSGNLYFKEEEFYKEVDGIETPFPNPYFQLTRNIRFMKEFLRNVCPTMKVTGAVIITAKSSRIREKPSHYPIFKLESMMEKIYQMHSNGLHEPVSLVKFEEITSHIEKNLSPYIMPPLCEYYRISPRDLVRGVECPKCGTLGMLRHSTTWKCPSCGKNDRNAHIAAVYEYFQLINNEITNRAFRDFCKIESKYSASRMLNSMKNLKGYGKANKRYFKLK
ncbi:NERD domain-containing protein [Psychrobacillus sp. Sa2BUA9]|uniref:NERD domain-containing protein n=1 Tax=Psychrobacillus faecigallinarum TaxID=2762235 RepID=A0ABR8R5I0_9BACI|nr:nuclease-related domain-containing protein [Psychrobacillus faecigallinarum]MBD7943053.1 NERD domain-containing protein [Psychrobacillus faecigallinarum]